MEAPLISRICIAAVLSVCSVSTYAQERSASGSVDLQMTWTALSNLVDSAVKKTEGLESRVNQIVVCNRKAKLYAPGPGSHVDGDGCIENSRIVALETAMKKVNADIVEINGEIEGIDDRLGTVEGKVKTIEGTLKTHTSQINTLNTETDDLYRRVAALASDMSTVKGQISNMQSTLSNHTTRLNSLDNVVASINSKIATINSQIAAINKEIDALTSRVTATEGNVNKILNCGDSGKIYDKSTNKCVNATATAPSCTIENTSASGPKNGWSCAATGAYRCTGQNRENDCLRQTDYYICSRITCD